MRNLDLSSTVNQKREILESSGIRKAEPFYYWPRKASTIHSSSGLTGIGGRSTPPAPEEGICPATKWPKEQRNLHNKVSEDILKTLPLRFLVVASACVKKHYRR